MNPMHLSGVENNPDAQGAYAELIRGMQASGQPVSQIWHLFAYKPHITQHLERMSHEIMRGPSPLSPGFRELLATLTSARNRTPFCATSHAAAAAELLGGRTVVDAVMQDVADAPVSPEEKALLRFIEKVNQRANEVNAEDFAALHAAGWDDEAIYDAIAVCALFNFYNRWVSANGVCQMPDAAVAQTGRRIAEHGYLRTGREL